jgi:hypothetical protein
LLPSFADLELQEINGIFLDFIKNSSFFVKNIMRGYTEGSMIQVNQVRVEGKEPFAIYSEHHLTGGD